MKDGSIELKKGGYENRNKLKIITVILINVSVQMLQQDARKGQGWRLELCNFSPPLLFSNHCVILIKLGSILHLYPQIMSSCILLIFLLFLCNCLLANRNCSLHPVTKHSKLSFSLSFPNVTDIRNVTKSWPLTNWHTAKVWLCARTKTGTWPWTVDGYGSDQEVWNTW